MRRNCVVAVPVVFGLVSCMGILLSNLELLKPQETPNLTSQGGKKPWAQGSDYSIGYSGRSQASVNRSDASQKSTIPKKRAFLTLVAGADFIRGVRALGCSLRTAAEEEKAELLALCYNLKRSQLAEVEAAGWRCSSPPQVENPSKTWVFDYTLKVAPFNFTEYDRIVLVDSDAVGVPSSSSHGAWGELFKRPLAPGHIMAAQDCLSWWAFGGPKVKYQIQAGVLVIQPSAETFAALNAAVPWMESLDGGGQGFISEFFRGKVSWLPAKFNYLRISNCVALIDASTGLYKIDPDRVRVANNSPLQEAQEKAQQDVALGNVLIVHFQGRPKPWSGACQKRNDKSLAAAGKEARASGWSCGASGYGGSTGIDILFELWALVDQKCQKEIGSVRPKKNKENKKTKKNMK